METVENKSEQKQPVGNNPINNHIEEESENPVSMVGSKALIVLMMGIIFGLICLCMDALTHSRVSEKLLTESRGEFVSKIISYGIYFSCFTLLSVFFVEVSSRKSIKYFQYILIGAALCVNYMMLVAFSEKVPFIGAYFITSALTTAQIYWFINSITKEVKASAIVGVVLVAEFVFMLAMAYLQHLALLIGSITLFALISLAMYLTTKLSSNKEQQAQ